MYRIMKKTSILTLALITTLVVSTAACGSSAGAKETAAGTAAVSASSEAQETQAAASETEAETETETETETEVEAAAEEENVEEEAASETETETTEEETEAPGPFSDPAAFEGFNTVLDYQGNTILTFGETTFGTLDRGLTISSVRQFKDDTHAAYSNPEALEPGAFGLIETTYWTKEGNPLSYRIYNPTDEPLAFEDCIIIGVMNDDGINFANGIRFYSSVEDIIAILGEPNDAITNDHGGSESTRYWWCDENNDHVLIVTTYTSGDVTNVVDQTYINRSILAQ